MSDQMDSPDQDHGDLADQPRTDEPKDGADVIADEVSDVVDTTGITEADDEHVNRAEGPVL